MAHTRKHARRLLSELDLPADAPKVLQHPSYWDPGFCEMYLDLCDETIFHDRETGLALARVAPDLVLSIPEGNHPADRQDHRERLVRAYATLGGAYRAVGQPHRANGPYRHALKLAELISPAARADLSMRLATLRTCQKRFDEAVALGKKAADIFRSLKRFDQLACALAAQAFGTDVECPPLSGSSRHRPWSFQSRRMTSSRKCTPLQFARSNAAHHESDEAR